MTASSVVDLMRHVFLTTFWLSVPVLAAGFAIGILVSLAQILTSIQDSSFSTVPRLAVYLVTFLVAMPWMFGRLMDYTISLFGNFAKFAH